MFPLTGVKSDPRRSEPHMWFRYQTFTIAAISNTKLAENLVMAGILFLSAVGMPRPVAFH